MREMQTRTGFESDGDDFGSADLLYVGEGVTAVTDGSFVARILFRMKSWRHHQADPPRGVFVPVWSD
ncbi:hypothetical protein E2C01_044083 [Portunus trituberculatus]|uniref:Uncharacterized protein n=1 Tax=Portunus trituberculatus TaxID=210409 RepID=A0A5B7FYF9_PORTR|nr:hypothetical protein [Portunus trituberculatus]